MSDNLSKTAEGLSAVAARGAKVIRGLTEKNASLETENAQLRDKVASFERVERLRALASEMEDRGLSPDLSYAEKVASLSKHHDLEKVAQAIQLVGAGRLELPRVSDETGPGTQSTSKDLFHDFLVRGHTSF
jgi:hypothetical protein